MQWHFRCQVQLLRPQAPPQEANAGEFCAIVPIPIAAEEEGLNLRAMRPELRCSEFPIAKECRVCAIARDSVHPPFFAAVFRWIGRQTRTVL